MKRTKRTPRMPAKLVHTNRAIRKIKNPAIRKDFAEMLKGLEFCVANGNKTAARKCYDMLIAMAIGLNRTISPAVAVGIFDGLLEDRKQDPVALPIGNGVDKKENHRCSFGVGCVESQGSACYTFSGVGVCGGASRFIFPWSRKVA